MVLVVDDDDGDNVGSIVEGEWVVSLLLLLPALLLGSCVAAAGGNDDDTMDGVDDDVGAMVVKGTMTLRLGAGVGESANDDDDVNDDADVVGSMVADVLGRFVRGIIFCSVRRRLVPVSSSTRGAGGIVLVLGVLVVWPGAVVQVATCFAACGSSFVSCCNALDVGCFPLPCSVWVEIRFAAAAAAATMAVSSSS